MPPPGEKALSWGIQAAERGWCTAGKRLYKQRVSRSEREGDGGKGAWVRLCRPGGRGTLGLRSAFASKLIFSSPITPPQHPVRTPLGRV